MHEPTRRAPRQVQGHPAAGCSFCLSGGAGLKREVKEAFHEAGVLIIEGYGLTETSPTLTLNRPDAFRFDTVGKPLPTVRAQARRGRRDPRQGARTCSAATTRIAEATREMFTEDGWFKTGDVGRFTEDGFLQIIDRKKDILVTAGGKNVPPANIELRFRDDPFIAHVVVYGDGEEVPRRRRVAQRGGRAAPPRGGREGELRALVQKRIDAVNARARELRDAQEVRHLRSPAHRRERAAHAVAQGASQEGLRDASRTRSRPSTRSRARERGRGHPAPLRPRQADAAGKAPRGHDAVRRGVRREQVELLRYRPRPEGIAHQTPVLLVPSLINRHYVLDLLPGKSFAEYLVQQGYDVYCIDWGTPGSGGSLPDVRRRLRSLPRPRDPHGGADVGRREDARARVLPRRHAHGDLHCGAPGARGVADACSPRR